MWFVIARPQGLRNPGGNMTDASFETPGLRGPWGLAMTMKRERMLGPARGHKSFLLLFFKKEDSFFLLH
jgi:hypothetical protein